MFTSKSPKKSAKSGPRANIRPELHYIRTAREKLVLARGPNFVELTN